MRSKISLEKGNWVSKSVRLRPEMLKLYYIIEKECYIVKDIKSDEVFNNIIETFYKNMKNIKNIEYNDYEGTRLVKGFTLLEKNLDKLSEIEDYFNKKFKYKCIAIEIMIYWYAYFHCKSKLINESEFGFVKFL